MSLMKDLFQLWPETLLFERKTLEDISEKDMADIIKKVYAPGLIELRVPNVTAILCLLYDARKVNPEKFLQKVFLPWIYHKERTVSYYDRILTEMSRTKEFKAYSENDILHSCNVYRNIVSELFDPMLTLLYAAYKFIEGDESNLFELDLHVGERQKYEYVQARIKSDSLFCGYNPDVRNAMSHPGGNGITIDNGVVVFKSIKRGKPPKVNQITWSYDDLFIHIIQLMEFVHSLSISSEIFGIDSMDLISEDFNTMSQMIHYVFSGEQEALVQRKSDDYLHKLRNDLTLSGDERLRILTKIFAKECLKREIPVPKVGYSKDKNVFVATIANDQDKPVDDQDLQAVVSYLARYVILARTIYQDLFGKYCVVEKLKNGGEISVFFPVDLIDKYICKEAGLVDLLNDGQFYENGQAFKIKYDFDVLEVIEQQQLGKPFPRLSRNKN